MKQRLQKIIAQSGRCSRRKAEDWILLGYVTVNGKTAQIGEQADPDVDEIVVRGKKLKAKQEHVYYALNKPIGIISSSDDEMGRDNVLSLVPKKPRVFSVGRLDKDTEGLLLLTNDGDWANSIMHPKFNITKTYEVTVNKPFLQEDSDRLKQGVAIDGKKITPDSVDILSPKQIKLVIHEGQKRVVRRMMGRIDFDVVNLKRTHIGTFELGSIKIGTWRPLTESEQASFK